MELKLFRNHKTLRYCSFTSLFIPVFSVQIIAVTSFFLRLQTSLLLFFFLILLFCWKPNMENRGRPTGKERGLSHYQNPPINNQLKELTFSNANFVQHIRKYNSVMAFTSFSAMRRDIPC